MEMEHTIVEGIQGTRFEKLSKDVVEAAKKSLIDTLAVTIAGRKAEGCEILFRLVKEWGGKKEATVLTYGKKVPYPNAVFVNAVMARALDLDEVHDIGTVHPSACILPATLGAVEFVNGATGKEFITAIAIGIDLICRMSLAPAVGSCISGMNFTYQCGTFGAAAAAGKILKLDHRQMINALGIAYSQAAGNSQCYVDGALTVRVQQGLSAKAGALSAVLAGRGITGAEEFFEGKFGYFNIYHGGQFNRDILLKDYGGHFEGIQVSQKPLYSCCKFNHASMDAARALVQEYQLKPYQIEHIKAVVTSQEVYNFVCDPIEVKKNPRTPVDAQFSLPYTVAVAVLKEKVSLDDFTQEAIKNEDVLNMARKIEVELKPKEGRAILPAPGIIEVRTVDGRRISKEVHFVKGHPRHPNSLEDCLEKMKACIEYRQCKKIMSRFPQIRELLLNLENLSDIRPVITLFNP